MAEETETVSQEKKFILIDENESHQSMKSAFDVGVVVSLFLKERYDLSHRRCVAFLGAFLNR